MILRLLIATLAVTAFGSTAGAVGWQDSGTYLKFDVYDRTRNETETRVVLDNLAKQLNTDSTLKAHLLAYAGKEACRNEAKLRLREAKRYLKEKHNIDSHQVTFVDGGFREDWVVQIWIGSGPNRLPEKEPTLSKKQVRITNNCHLPSL